MLLAVEGRSICLAHHGRSSWGAHIQFSYVAVTAALSSRQVTYASMTASTSWVQAAARRRPALVRPAGPVQGSYLADVLGPSLLIPLGLGLAFVPITILSVTGVTDREYGLASGMVNTSQQVGGALGLAALSTIATTRTNHLAATYHAIKRHSCAGPDRPSETSASDDLDSVGDAQAEHRGHGKAGLTGSRAERPRAEHIKARRRLIAGGRNRERAENQERDCDERCERAPNALTKNDASISLIKSRRPPQFTIVMSRTAAEHRQAWNRDPRRFLTSLNVYTSFTTTERSAAMIGPTQQPLGGG